MDEYCASFCPSEIFLVYFPYERSQMMERNESKPKGY
jgi:hypothetical protein